MFLIDVDRLTLPRYLQDVIFIIFELLWSGTSRLKQCHKGTSSGRCVPGGKRLLLALLKNTFFQYWLCILSSECRNLFIKLHFFTYMLFGCYLVIVDKRASKIKDANKKITETNLCIASCINKEPVTSQFWSLPQAHLMFLQKFLWMTAYLCLISRKTG